MKNSFISALLFVPKFPFILGGIFLGGVQFILSKYVEFILCGNCAGKLSWGEGENYRFSTHFNIFDLSNSYLESIDGGGLEL